MKVGNFIQNLCNYKLFDGGGGGADYGNVINTK
jgi:hypothetical protein